MSINISNYSTNYGASLNKWASYMSSEELMKQMRDSTKKVSSSIVALPVIDDKALNDVGEKNKKDTQAEEDRKINDFVNAGDGSDSNKGKESSNEKDMKEKKPTKSGIFPMLFKIVPIGLNIFKKFPKVMSGLADEMTAIQQLIVNSIITVSELVPSSLAFIMLNFSLSVIYVICGVTNLKNMHICCIPYACEFICWILKTALCSFVNILDTIMIKSLIGFPLYDLVKYGLDMISGLIYFPDFIMETCYSCKLTKNNSLYDALVEYSKQTGTRIGKIVTQDVPPRIIKPAVKGITGIGKMTSIFNI